MAQDGKNTADACFLLWRMRKCLQEEKGTEFQWSGGLKMGGSIGIDGARSRVGHINLDKSWLLHEEHHSQ